MMIPMHYTWKSFSALTAHELYEIMMIRQKVFIVEQNCAYLDADGFDQKAWHLLSWDINKKNLYGYVRVIPSGIKYPELSIGRVVTSPEVRQKGYGKSIMKEAINTIENIFGTVPIRISAQAYLEKFYSSFGFKTVRGPYPEDGIPHLEMLRRP